MDNFRLDQDETHVFKPIERLNEIIQEDTNTGSYDDPEITSFLKTEEKERELFAEDQRNDHEFQTALMDSLAQFKIKNENEGSLPFEKNKVRNLR